MLAHSLSFADLTCDILLFSVIAQAAPLQPLASSVLVSISIFASLNRQWHESHFRSGPADALKGLPSFYHFSIACAKHANCNHNLLASGIWITHIDFITDHPGWCHCPWWQARKAAPPCYRYDSGLAKKLPKNVPVPSNLQRMWQKHG